MNTKNLMKDPYYSNMLFAIEGHINRVSEEAKAEGILFSDSNVKSVLNKVKNTIKGKYPKTMEGKRKEELLSLLIDDLSKLPDDMKSDRSKKDWILAFKCVEDSLKHRTGGSGSRAYLDYLINFVAQAS